MDFQKSVAISSFCVIIWWFILFFLPQHITTPVFLLANAEYVSGNFRKAVMILNTGIPVNSVPIQWVCSYFLSLSLSHPSLLLIFVFRSLVWPINLNVTGSLKRDLGILQRKIFLNFFQMHARRKSGKFGLILKSQNLEEILVLKFQDRNS